MSESPFERGMRENWGITYNLRNPFREQRIWSVRSEEARVEEIVEELASRRKELER